MAVRDEAQAGGGTRGRAAGRVVVADPARAGVRAKPGGRVVAAGPAVQGGRVAADGFVPGRRVVAARAQPVSSGEGGAGTGVKTDAITGAGTGVGGGVGETPSPGAAAAGCNEVRLVGRVSGRPEERELPSGDSLVAWRVVVDRPATGRRPPAGVRSPTVDTLDCVAWSAGLRRTARGLRDGDVVEVSGALRRRFWRTGAGAVSRTEVEADRVRRVSRRTPAD